MFGRGDLKYALLDLLQERPKHGYEMIKELESRAGGFYTPSAGAVYPTLQLLEDRGWVTAETTEGKKVSRSPTPGGRRSRSAATRRRSGLDVDHAAPGAGAIPPKDCAASASVSRPRTRPRARPWSRAWRTVGRLARQPGDA